MALKTLGLVSLGIKAVVLFLIVVVICIGSYGIFGSDAYKARDGDGSSSRRHGYGYGRRDYDSRHFFEQAFIALAVLSFLVGCGTLVFNFISPTNHKLWIILGDIGVCTVSALLLLGGGGFLLMTVNGECSKDSSLSSIHEIRDSEVCGNSNEYYILHSIRACVDRICREKYLTPVKTAAAVIALVIALVGFCVPCGLAVKVHKKREPENAGDAMGGVGGYQEQPGGAYGGVVAGSPAYPMYGAPPPPPPPQYQVQYGGAYGYATPQPVAPQMSPSQNPAVAYPQGVYPPQGIPQYAPQEGQQST